MNPINLKQLKIDWLKKETELIQKRPRRYLHFDKKIQKISQKTISEITNPKSIEQHSFFPLIQRIQSNRVYKKNSQTKYRYVQRKNRPISYASHFDALIYSWYAMFLSHFYEIRLKRSGLHESVIAYRKLNKSNIDFAKEVFDFIKNKKECTSINIDIEKFYDTLDFKVLKKAWIENLSSETMPEDHYSVFKSLTRFAYVRLREIWKLLKVGSEDTRKIRFFLGLDVLGDMRKKNKIKTNKLKGIPQGTPISCVLSNIYMHGFDIAVANKIRDFDGFYRRYSDDIIILCPKEELENINSFILEEISKIKLKIQSTKTEIRHFTEQDGKVICRDQENKKSKLQYLGIEFDGENTLLRHKGYAKFERKMIRSIRKEVAVAKDLKVGIAKRKIYEKYSPLGKANYISYANKVAKELNSPLITNQVTHGRIMKKISGKIKKSMESVNNKK